MRLFSRLWRVSAAVRPPKTLTVTVRGLALGRELLLGLVNGVRIGLIVAVIARLWKGTRLLALFVGDFCQEEGAEFRAVGANSD